MVARTRPRTLRAPDGAVVGAPPPLRFDEEPRSLRLVASPQPPEVRRRTTRSAGPPPLRLAGTVAAGRASIPPRVGFAPPAQSRIADLFASLGSAFTFTVAAVCVVILGLGLGLLTGHLIDAGS